MTPEISIRKLQKGDLTGLKELYKDAFNSETDENKMLEVFSRIETNDDYIVLCALAEETVIGSVLGVICHELIGKCTPFLVIEDVAVLSSHRRLGVAKKLMVEIESRARLKQCNMILFVSSEHRTGAHQLYESLGYASDKVNGYRKRLTYAYNE
jgi:predicted N-acetyltransferase YhbS